MFPAAFVHSKLVTWWIEVFIFDQAWNEMMSTLLWTDMLWTKVSLNRTLQKYLFEMSWPNLLTILASFAASSTRSQGVLLHLPCHSTQRAGGFMTGDWGARPVGCRKLMSNRNWKVAGQGGWCGCGYRVQAGRIRTNVLGAGGFAESTTRGHGRVCMSLMATQRPLGSLWDGQKVGVWVVHERVDAFYEHGLDQLTS